MAPYDNSLWYIETNVHPLLENAKDVPKMVNYIRPTFWQRFTELNRVMWETNAALTERHAYDSRPMTWPVLRRGINFWAKDHRQVYLIGNPFIWWGSLCAIMVYAGARAILMLRAKRGFKDYQDTAIVYYDQTCGFLALGWAMHFFPFFAMNRQLFIHHYLPALYFSILLLAVLFDVLTAGLRPKYRFFAAMLMILVAFSSYSTYAPITYATPWTSKSCERARLLKTWDLNCKEFPESLSAYKSLASGGKLDVWSRFGAEEKAAGEGAVTSAVADEIAMPQAGNHPFEQAPKKVEPSNAGAQHHASEEEEDDDDQDHHHAERVEADKVQPEVAAPVPAAPVEAGTPEVPAGQAVLQKEQTEEKHEWGKKKEKEAQQPSDLKGMDQEGIEGIVLSGTASQKDKSRAPANAATTPSIMARADEPADAKTL